MPKQKITQENLFLVGILWALVVGLIGNFFVSQVYRTIDKPTYLNFILTIIFGIITISICFWIYSKIEKRIK